MGGEKNRESAWYVFKTPLLLRLDHLLYFTQVSKLGIKKNLFRAS